MDRVTRTVQPPVGRMKDRFTAKESGLPAPPPGCARLSSEPGLGRVRPTLRCCSRLTARGLREASPRTDVKQGRFALTSPHISPSQAPVSPDAEALPTGLQPHPACSEKGASRRTKRKLRYRPPQISARCPGEGWPRAQGVRRAPSPQQGSRWARGPRGGRRGLHVGLSLLLSLLVDLLSLSSSGKSQECEQSRSQSWGESDRATLLLTSCVTSGSPLASLSPGVKRGRIAGLHRLPALHSQPRTAQQ